MFTNHHIDQLLNAYKYTHERHLFTVNAIAISGSTNHYLIEKIQRRHWIAQAQQVGLGEKTAKQLIVEIIESTDAVIEEVSQLLPGGFPVDLAEAIFGGMKKHCAKLATIRS